MSLVGNPIPPLDHTPHASGAPPGVGLDLDAYDSDWVASRPTIRPRVGVVHTNGGSGEGSYGGAIGWSNAKDDNTHAHYNLNAPWPSKNLATSKRAIGNSTPAAKEREFGVSDASFWTIVVETADRGWKNGGNTDLGDFLYDHDELLARIIAYESIVWDIPIVVPDEWTGTGWLTHTAPFDGVYTIYTAKSCPGTTKKARVLNGDILPRAQEIYEAWTGTGDNDMKVLDEPIRVFDSRGNTGGALPGGTSIPIKLPTALRGTAVSVTVTAIRPAGSTTKNPSGEGYVTVWCKGGRPTASCLNYKNDNVANTTSVKLDGDKFQLFASAPTHIAVDVVGVYA